MVNNLECYPVGTCLQMCPEKEVRRREKEKLLHRLEMVKGTERSKFPKADYNKVVKCFCRSAADTCLSAPDNLRPFPVLCKTVFHLLNNTVNDPDVQLMARYNFIENRLRAVRQDMVIQAMEPSDCIVLLEPMIKFHLVFGYKLCDYPVSMFDPVLNTKHLMECLKQLLVCYDTLDNNNIFGLITEMEKLDLKRGRKLEDPNTLKNSQLMRNRSFFEAIYIVANLGDSSPLIRFLNIAPQYKSRLGYNAFHMSVAFSKGMYVTVSYIIRNLSPLCLCVAALQLTNIQKKALTIMSHAYTSKIQFPKDVLVNSLLYNNVQQLDVACNHFGIEKTDEYVVFNKTKFKYDANAIPPQRVHFVDKRLAHFGLEDLLLQQCYVVDIVKTFDSQNNPL